MAIHRALQGLTEITEEVPAICHLHGLRCTLPYGISIGASTVTGDNLDPAMPLQPGRERAGLAVRQQVDDFVAFQVDQDGSVVRPRRHAQSSTASTRGVGGRGATARWTSRSRVSGLDRHGQPPGEAGGGLAAESETESALDARQPRGSARRAGRDEPQRLGKGLARTAGIATAETAHPDQEHGRTPLPGQVHQPALVVGVDAGGGLVAAGTGRGRGPKRSDDGDLVGRRYDPLHREAGPLALTKCPRLERTGSR